MVDGSLPWTMLDCLSAPSAAAFFNNVFSRLDECSIARRKSSLWSVFCSVWRESRLGLAEAKGSNAYSHSSPSWWVKISGPLATHDVGGGCETVSLMKSHCIMGYGHTQKHHRPFFVGWSFAFIAHPGLKLHPILSHTSHLRRLSASRDSGPLGRRNLLFLSNVAISCHDVPSKSISNVEGCLKALCWRSWTPVLSGRSCRNFLQVPGQRDVGSETLVLPPKGKSRIINLVASYMGRTSGFSPEENTEYCWRTAFRWSTPMLLDTLLQVHRTTLLTCRVRPGRTLAMSTFLDNADNAEVLDQRGR